MPSCCAIGCRSGYPNKQPGISFHKIPVDVERRKAWIEAIGRKDWVPSNTVNICSLHFEEHCFDRTSVNVLRLKKDAVPTIFKDCSFYKKKKKNYTKVTTTSVDTVSLEKEIKKEKERSIPTIFNTWQSDSKSKKKCSEVTETGNVVEAGSCSKVDSVSGELSDTGSDFESLAKVDSGSKELSYSSSNLTTMQLKRKIQYLEQQNELKSKEIKSLQRFKRLAVRKIRNFRSHQKNLEDVIKFLKENKMAEEDSLKVLTFNRPMYPIGNIISTKLNLQHQS